jgi:hypothetical protein
MGGSDYKILFRDEEGFALKKVKKNIDQSSCYKDSDRAGKD